MQIKPIETIYNGYRFRSRLEARWAVFFDALSVKYEYEKEGYNLGELGWYLPDFWLPEYQMFAEVKGENFTNEEYDKCDCLVTNIPDSGCLFLAGTPCVKPYFGIVNLEPSHTILSEKNTDCTHDVFKPDVPNNEIVRRIYVSRNRQLYAFDKTVAVFNFILCCARIYENQTIRTFPLCHWYNHPPEDLTRAVDKAKSARFEFDR